MLLYCLLGLIWPLEHYVGGWELGESEDWINSKLFSGEGELNEPPVDYEENLPSSAPP